MGYIKNFCSRILSPKGKIGFLSSLKKDAVLLDVGCGNNSSFRAKSVLPMCTYVGIDVADYNQTKPIMADRYIIAQPENFSNEISNFVGEFDAVISSHNIEHCDDRFGTLHAMLKAVKDGGRFYISFPCQDSVNFESRVGTLNYYDDATHKDAPPDFDEIVNTLKSHGFVVEYYSRNYKPIIRWILGLIIEPYMKTKRSINSFGWAYYGFESIIWAKKEG